MQAYYVLYTVVSILWYMYLILPKLDQVDAIIVPILQSGNCGGR